MANNPHYLELMRRARRDHLRNIRRASGEIASLYEDAAKELSAQAASMGRRTLSRRWAAEYAGALKQRAAQLRAGLYDVTYQGLKRSANLPIAANGDFWESIGGQSFRDMFAVTPDDILANLINGQIYKDNMGLSDRIWRASGSFEKDIDYMVNRGIAEHKSAYELAKDLEQYVKPKARRDWDWGKVYPNLAGKQVDYSAQRLARTAINHAYFLSNQKVCRQNPYIEAMHWQLSDSHDERQVIPFGPDECDEYAQHDEGLGMGNWKPEQIPLPHPQCLCIQYGVVTQSLEEIGDEIGRWIAGEPNVRLDSWNALYGRNYDRQNGTASSDAGVGNSPLQNDASSGRMKTDSDTVYHDVTDDAIERVPRVSVSDDEVFNERYQKAGQDLLRTVKASGAEAGTEFSIVYDREMNRIGEYIRGDVGHVKIDNPDELYHALHNHGSGLTFSLEDLVGFTRRDNMLSISAVGNNGSIYCLMSTIDADKNGYSGYLYFMQNEPLYEFNGISYTYGDLINKRLNLDLLNKEQREDFGTKVVNFGERCAKAGEKYGFRYFKQSS